MNKALYLCLDQGGSSSRAIVFNSDGRSIAQSQLPVSERRQGARVEQDSEQLVHTLMACANSVLAQLNPQQRAELKCCGLITQRSSLVAFDKTSGLALSPVLSWQDTRAAEFVPNGKDYSASIYQHTGLMPNAHFGASKMCWLLQHCAEVKQAQQQQTLMLAPLSCYLAHRLLENKPLLVDRGNASRTMLLDIQSGEWSGAMLDLFGLSATYLPTVVASDSNWGVLALEQLSLPMQLLSGDQCAAAFAQGLMPDEQVSINVGTGAFLLSPITVPTARDGLLNSIVHWSEKAFYCLEGTVNAAGVALKTMAESLQVDKAIERLDKLFQQYELASNERPLFINSISGLASPDWRSDLEAGFINDNNEGINDDQRMLAVAESIVFLLQRNLDCMIKLKPQLKRILISGGLSQSDSLCQCLANLSGLPVERGVEVEASARGAVFLLAGMPQRWPVNRGEIFSAMPQQLLSQRYQQWTKALAQRLKAKPEFAPHGQQ